MTEIREHGIEVIRLSSEEVTPPNTRELLIRVRVKNTSLDPVEISGTIIPSGLTTGGLMTELTLTTTPVALPATALTNRNTLSIQNQDLTNDVMINYVSSFSSGWLIYAGGYKEIPVTDNIIIYGRSVVGTAVVLIDEIA